MKILHMLSDGPTELSSKVIEVQSGDNEVKVVDLSKKETSYDVIVDDMFSFDKVVCW
jgi:hypothetical protein